MIGEAVARWMVVAFGVYGLVGVLFALAFVLVGVDRVDPTAARSTRGFRVMIFPGSVALWPMLLARWLVGGGPPQETNDHRTAARRNP